jgi:hypothetical protein
MARQLADGRYGFVALANESRCASYMYRVRFAEACKLR